MPTEQTEKGKDIKLATTSYNLLLNLIYKKGNPLKHTS